MTALGDDTANVVGLIYIAAFGLDAGESINAVGADFPPPRALANIVVDERGFGRLPEDDFVGHFAADVAPARARVMHAAQQPVAMSVLGDVMHTPAWRSPPSWYLVSADDQAIPPDEERMFARRMGGRDGRGGVEPRPDGLPPGRRRRAGGGGGERHGRDRGRGGSSA